MIDMAHPKVAVLLVGAFLLWKCIHGLPVEDTHLNNTFYNIEGETLSEVNSSGVFIVLGYPEENYDDITIGPSLSKINASLRLLEVKQIENEDISQVSLRISKIYEVNRHNRLSIDICFLFGLVIIIEAIHLFCLQYFIRLTRTRFGNHKRFNFYSTLILVLGFFISFLNLLLVILFYKSIEFCK